MKKLEGGALPERTAAPPKPQEKNVTVVPERQTQRFYKDTPAKRAVRELSQHWVPIFGNQETPPFSEMHHAAHNYDTTSFENTEMYYAMPPKAPTGGGLHHTDEDRETSHFFGQFLESENPELAVLYRGGAANDHQDRVQNNIHMDYTTTDDFGRATLKTGAYTGRQSFSVPENRYAPNYFGRPMEIFMA